VCGILRADRREIDRRSASAPRHYDIGFETLVILDGAQSDEADSCRKSDVIVNLPGLIHCVTSKPGCRMLVVWQKRIEFLEF
jgi:anti-sigma factor ChrR (cupin superfamily)